MRTQDNLELNETIWKVNNPKALILLVHGYAEHAGRYAHVARYFNDHGISIYGLDLRGHGRSEGKRAYIDSFEQYTADIQDWISQYQNIELPTFIYAHSMGGLVATSYLLKYELMLKDFRGLLLTGPLFMPNQDLAPLLIKFSAVIGKYLPKLKTINLDANLVSSDPEEVRKYETDPLVYTGKWYARTAAELVKQMKSINQIADQFSFPLFIAHGAKDGLVELEGSKRFYAYVKSTDKVIHIVEDAFHELVNEPSRQNTMDLMLDWVAKRIDQAN